MSPGGTKSNSLAVVRTKLALILLVTERRLYSFSNLISKISLSSFSTAGLFISGHLATPDSLRFSDRPWVHS